MDIVQPAGFQRLLKSTSLDGRRKTHRTTATSRKLDAAGVQTTSITPSTSSHRFIKMLNDAVNKMHDCKVQHEKVSEYNLALILIHKINVLFTVQRSFVDAENLARVLYTEELVNSVVDVLIEGGDLAYIPGQLLVHLTTNPECVEYLLEDDIIAVVCGVLRVGESLFRPVGIAIFRNLADFCRSSVYFASKMRSRTKVLKLLLQRYVDDIQLTKALTSQPHASDATPTPEKSAIVMSGNADDIVEILSLIQYIICGTMSRSHIDDLRDAVQSTIIDKVVSDETSNENKVILNLARKITRGAERRKRHVSKDVDYEKANKSRRRDGYAAAKI